MPCTRGTASAQIRRLSQLPFYGTLTNEALTSMVDALSTNAVDAEHAARAVSAWLQDSRGENARVATEGDLIALLEKTHPGVEQRSDAPPSGGYCGRCRSGWVHVERRTPHGEVHSYAGRCKCVGGTVEPPPPAQGSLL